jgi:hypothetical protein
LLSPCHDQLSAEFAPASEEPDFDGAMYVSESVRQHNRSRRRHGATELAANVEAPTRRQPQSMITASGHGSPRHGHQGYDEEAAPVDHGESVSLLRAFWIGDNSSATQRAIDRLSCSVADWMTIGADGPAWSAVRSGDLRRTLRRPTGAQLPRSAVGSSTGRSDSRVQLLLMPTVFGRRFWPTRIVIEGSGRREFRGRFST